MATPSTAKPKGSAPQARVATANAVPVANNDSNTAALLLETIGNVLTNDRDNDAADMLVVTAAGRGLESRNPTLSSMSPEGITLVGTYGTLLLRADGSYVYTINSSDTDFRNLARGSTATENFTYQVSDGAGGSDKATLAIRVTGANRGPVASDDKGSKLGNVLTNDRDLDRDALQVVGIARGEEASRPELAAVAAGTTGTTVRGVYGTLVIQANGSYTYALDTTDADYLALGKGASANETFTYLASDGKGGSDTATLAIKVTGVNDVVVADNDTGSVGNVLANDRDPDAGDRLVVTSAGRGEESANPRLSNVPAGANGATIVGTYGVLNIKADGSYAYTLNTQDADYVALSGGVEVTENFTYTVSDGKGSTDKATIAIRVVGANHQPVAADDVAFSGNVLANDRDVDVNDVLRVSAAGRGGESSAPELSSVASSGSTVIEGRFGSLSIAADGTYSYAVNAADADFTALARGVTASEQFTYEVSDGQGGKDKASIALTVTGANRLPDAQNDTGNQGNVLANDRDAEVTDVLRVESVISSVNVNETAVPFNLAGARVEGKYGELFINAFGDYEYAVNTADSDYLAIARGATTTENFRYTVGDGNGGTDTATITVQVLGSNRAPVAVDDVVRSAPSLTGDLLANDTDADLDTLRVLDLGVGAEGDDPDLIHLDQMSYGITLSGKYGNLMLNANGSYTYVQDTSTDDFQLLARGTTAADSFTYRVSDGMSGTDTATLSVIVTGRNYVPQAIDDNISMSVRVTESSGNVLTNDIDLDTDESLSVMAATFVNDWEQSATVDAGGVTLVGNYGSLLIKSDGSYVYTLDNLGEDFQSLAGGETDSDTFQYLVIDENGGEDSASLNVLVTGSNNRPTAANDEGTSGNVLFNDFDIDRDDEFSVTMVSNGEDSLQVTSNLNTTVISGTYGTLSILSGGNYHYVLNTQDLDYQLLHGESAVEVFSYSVTDLAGASDVARLEIDINPGFSNSSRIMPSSFAAVSDSAIPSDLLDGETILAAVANQQQTISADPFALTIASEVNTSVASAQLESSLSSVAALFNSVFAFDADRADDDAVLIVEASDKPGDFAAYQFASANDGSAVTSDELTLLAVAYDTSLTASQFLDSLVTPT